MFLTRKDILLLKRDALGSPRPYDLVVVLVVRHRNRLVNKISDGLELSVQDLLLLSSLGEHVLLFLFELGLLREEFGDIFLGLFASARACQIAVATMMLDEVQGLWYLLLGADLLLDLVDLGVELCGCVLSCYG